MDKQDALRRTKRLAFICLLAAAALFIIASLAPPSWWSGLLRAMAEAAMVGALADWFAVSALFRRIPLPLLSRHTDIIARNKERIAHNLAVFVEEKFLSPQSLAALIRRHDPAQHLARWMALRRTPRAWAATWRGRWAAYSCSPMTVASSPSCARACMRR